MKIQETLAQIGGLIQFLKLFIAVIYSNYNQHYYFQDLFNTFFSFKQKETFSNERKKSSLVKLNIFEEKTNIYKNGEVSNNIDNNTLRIDERMNEAVKVELELSKEPSSDKSGLPVIKDLISDKRDLEVDKEPKSEKIEESNFNGEISK